MNSSAARTSESSAFASTDDARASIATTSSSARVRDSASRFSVETSRVPVAVGVVVAASVRKSEVASITRCVGSSLPRNTSTATRARAPSRSTFHPVGGMARLANASLLESSAASGAIFTHDANASTARVSTTSFDASSPSSKKHASIKRSRYSSASARDAAVDDA